ncbi:MAG: hypothetical protein KAX65_04140 [Caldilineaceae bacterium]|nr:hypothetical protein [Caldilineaceae bacterium]
MAEIVTAETWLYTKLHGDATLLALVPGGVYTWPVPATYSGQYVLYQMQSGVDIRGVGPSRLGVNGLWLVRVVAEALSFGGNLQTAANRLDVLLQAASGTATGGTVWSCVREQPFQLVELANGRQFRHLGGIYRLWVQ